MLCPPPPSEIFFQKCFIDGTWVDADDHRQSTVINPGNLEVLGSVPHLSEQQIHMAIEGAHQAQQKWKSTSPHQRGNTLKRWAELCRQHRDSLALLLCLEQGKPLSEARGEIDYGTSFIDWFSEEAQRAYGDTITHPSPDKRITTHYEAIGVVGAITPWNFPNAMITRKVAPALAAGCSVVLKPAPETPFSALALAHLAHEAGLPTGLFQVVTGDAPEIGQIFCSHTKVKKLSFTGSSAVGIQLQCRAAPQLMRTSLELGGNAPFIVFEDANLEAAVQGLLISKLRNAGQTCVTSNRIYVHQKLEAPFLEKLAKAFSQFQVGVGWEHQNQMGPLIHHRAALKVQNHLNSALEQGAEIYGGEAPTLDPKAPAMVSPIVLRNVPFDSIFLREETFGPLAPITTFTDNKEALHWANASESGLAAYVYSEGHKRLTKAAENLQFGMVGLNEGLISTTVAPFGGIKASGLGREGSHHGLKEYLNIKMTCSGGHEPS